MARLLPHFATCMVFSYDTHRSKCISIAYGRQGYACVASEIAWSRGRLSHLRLGMLAGFVFAKVLLRYFPDRRLWQCVADLHGADHFVLSQPFPQERFHLLECERRRTGLQFDEGLRGLAAIVVRNSDDAHFLARPVLKRPPLDVAWIDVEPAAQEHVLGPVDDENEAVLVHIADVAGAKETVRRHCVRGLFRLFPVSLHDVRTLDADFAPLAELNLAVRVGDVDKLHLRAGIRKAAGAGPSCPLARVESSSRRSLRHAPTLVQLAADNAFEPFLHGDREPGPTR